MSDFKSGLTVKEYVMREDFSFHAPRSPEFEFYKYVMDGDVDKIKELLKEDFCLKTGFGKLSDNELRNFKYHFAITAALASRYCIDKGMEQELAFSLSDLYISNADTLTSPGELSALHRKMILDYTQRMNKIKNSNVLSKNIAVCVNYIYDHLHERLTLKELSSQIGISESYLSKTFKKEMGVPIGKYILIKKVEAARNMIDYSNRSLAEISNVLGFTSQSHFSAVFKQFEGVTPGQYKIKVFGSNISKEI